MSYVCDAYSNTKGTALLAGISEVASSHPPDNTVVVHAHRWHSVEVENPPKRLLAKVDAVVADKFRTKKSVWKSPVF